MPSPLSKIQPSRHWKSHKFPSLKEDYRFPFSLQSKEQISQIYFAPILLAICKLEVVKDRKMQLQKNPSEMKMKSYKVDVQWFIWRHT